MGFSLQPVLLCSLTCRHMEQVMQTENSRLAASAHSLKQHFRFQIALSLLDLFIFLFVF